MILRKQGKFYFTLVNIHDLSLDTRGGRLCDCEWTVLRRDR